MSAGHAADADTFRFYPSVLHSVNLFQAAQKIQRALPLGAFVTLAAQALPSVLFFLWTPLLRGIAPKVALSAVLFARTLIMRCRHVRQ